MIKNTLAVEPNSSRLRSAYIPLAKADPSLLVDQAIHTAYESLPSEELVVDNPEFEIVSLGFSQGLVAQWLEPLIGRLNTQFVDGFEDGRLESTLATILVTLDRLALPLPDQTFSGLLSDTRSRLGLFLETVGVEEGIKWLVSLLASTSDTPWQDAPTSQNEAAALAQDIAGPQPVPLAIELAYQTRSFSSAVNAGLIEGLQTALAGIDFGSEHWRIVVDGLLTFPTGTEALEKELLRGIGVGYATEVAELVNEFRTTMGERAETVVKELRERLEGLSDPGEFGKALEAFVKASLDTDPDQALSYLENELLEGRSEPTANALLTKELTRALGESGNRLRTSLMQSLASSGFAPERLAALRYLAACWPLTPSTSKAAIRGIVSQWIDNRPDCAAEISETTEPANDTVAGRDPIVRALLRATRNADDVDTRVRAALSAFKIAGSSATLTALCERTLRTIESRHDDSSRAVSERIRAARTAWLGRDPFNLL